MYVDIVILRLLALMDSLHILIPSISLCEKTTHHGDVGESRVCVMHTGVEVVRASEGEKEG